MSDGGKGSNARPYAIPKEEFNKQFDKIFGEKERVFCDVCNKRFSWCSCVPAPKELCEAIDNALGIKRKKKKVNND